MLQSGNEYARSYYKFCIARPTRMFRHHKFLQFPYTPSSLLPPRPPSRFLVCSRGLKRETAAGRCIFIQFRYTANRHATTLGQQEFISHYFLLVIYYHTLYIIQYMLRLYRYFFSIFFFFFLFSICFYLSFCGHSNTPIYACICNNATFVSLRRSF